MIERLTMIGLDRRGPRAGRGVSSDAATIRDRAHVLTGSDRRGGVVVLATCERFEVYVSAAPGAARPILATMLPGQPRDEVRLRQGIHAARHLLRVAAGLESRLVGETHVLGQVRRAADEAYTRGTIGRDLARLFSLALRCGKRIRNETCLGRAGATYATLAASQALDHIACGREGRVGIIGTGAIALEAGEALAECPSVRTVIVGRHPERTERLARHLGASAARLDALASIIPRLDAIITATGAPHPIVHRHDLAGARRGLLIIDLGMPPNVADGVRGLPQLAYRGLDDIAPDHVSTRAVLAEAEEIVERELGTLIARAPAMFAPSALEPTGARA